MTQAEAISSPSGRKQERGDWPGQDTALGAILPRKNWGWFMARGVLLIALGISALLRPGPALFAFAMLFAGFCFANGVMTIASGVRGARDKAERWWALLLSGMAGIVVGTLFVLFPSVSTFAYGLTTVMLLAAWAMVTGVFEISAAIRLRKEIEGEWLLALSGALSVLLGILVVAMALVQPAISILSVAWLIGIYALIAGVALVVLGFRLRSPSERSDPVGSAQPA